MARADARAPYLITLMGKSGSGKTTLAIKLIEALVARGYAVGSVKHHSRTDFEIDHEGKDSWRMREAGSRHVVVAAPNKIAHMRDIDHEMEFPEIAAEMTDVDVVVAEGYRIAGSPTLFIFRAGNPRTLGMQPDLSSELVVGVATDDENVATSATGQGLPVFDLDDADGICAFVVARIGRDSAGADGAAEGELA